MFLKKLSDQAKFLNLMFLRVFFNIRNFQNILNIQKI
nr:MAG TPA: hypothetical protein [Caudoviricetes sp.]